MKPETVEKLEKKIEEAIFKVLIKTKHLPSLPDRRTMHLMAKAAVTVYEAAVETTKEGT